MNAMMAELLALLGTRRIPSMPYRATAQAPVERVHIEEQRALGILLLGVFKGFGGEWGEMLPVVDFCYITHRSVTLD
jgi:hypothetical protein